MQVHLLLRAQAVEVVDMRALHEDSLGLLLQGGELLGRSADTAKYTDYKQMYSIMFIDHTAKIVILFRKTILKPSNIVDCGLFDNLGLTKRIHLTHCDE